MTQDNYTQDVQATSWTSLERFMYRSGRPQVFLEKDVQKNYSNSQRKPCTRVFYIGVVSLELATKFEKRLWHKCFPMHFDRIFRTAFLRTPVKSFIYI